MSKRNTTVEMIQEAGGEWIMPMYSAIIDPIYMVESSKPSGGSCSHAGWCGTLEDARKHRDELRTLPRNQEYDLWQIIKAHPKLHLTVADDGNEDGVSDD